MIYLDNAATTPLDPRVLDVMLPYLRQEFGNPGSIHSLGRRAQDAVEKARGQVAAFIGCSPEQIIFTSGATEANNLVFAGIKTELLRRNRRSVMISGIEHDSVWKAAHAMCIKHDFHLHICPPHTDGAVRLSSIEEQTPEDLGLLSVMYANNETGVVNDAGTIANWCRSHDVLFHTDAVQAAGIIPIDVSNTQTADMMTLSAHKIGGPKGIGALYVKDPKILSPLIYGGAEQERGYRGGTENVPAIVGFGEACKLAETEQSANFRYLQKERSQFLYTLKSLAEENSVEMRVNGDYINAVPKTLSLCFPGTDAETLVLMLDADGVCVSAGSACRAHESVPSRVLTAMSLSEEDARCTIRVSFSRHNKPEDNTRAAQTIIQCVKALGGGS